MKDSNCNYLQPARDTTGYLNAVSISHYYSYFSAKLLLKNLLIQMIRAATHTTVYLILIILLHVSCSTTEYVKEGLNDGEYDSEFPFGNASDELDRISRSVKLVNSMAFYRRFVFPQNKNLKMEDINDLIVDNESMYNERYTEMSSGTGTILESTRQHLTILTAAHVIDFDDTVYTYYSDSQGKVTDIVQSISFKLNQNIYSNLPKGGELEIIMLDEKNDVALVGMKGNNPDPLSFDHPEFNYPVGDSNELTWGNFVYIFGFPVNNKMLTRALVSRPNASNTKTYMVDAVLNRGASGGIVLAVRDGVPNFELVGIVSWLSAERTNVLSPQKLYNDQKYQIDSRYEGNLYIGEIEEVKYGLTKVVSTEAIRESLYDYEDEILAKGYNIPGLFSKKD